MDINNYLNNEFILSSPEGIAFSKKMATAQADVTFWGGRVVRFDGYEGSVILDTFANEMFREALADCLSQSEETPLTAAHRAAGVEIIKKTREFYQITDTKLAQANWFTRLCHWARSFFSLPIPRKQMESVETMYYYTAFPDFSFQAAFGVFPSKGFSEDPDLVATVVPDMTFNGHRYVPVNAILDPYLARAAAQ